MAHVGVDFFNALPLDADSASAVIGEPAVGSIKATPQ